MSTVADIQWESPRGQRRHKTIRRRTQVDDLIAARAAWVLFLEEEYHRDPSDENLCKLYAAMELWEQVRRRNRRNPAAEHE